MRRASASRVRRPAGKDTSGGSFVSYSFIVCCSQGSWAFWCCCSSTCTRLRRWSCVSGGTVERWNGGTVERWNGGTVERWNGGTVERWNGGTVERWNGGTVERWNAGTAERQNAKTNSFLRDGVVRKPVGQRW